MERRSPLSEADELPIRLQAKSELRKRLARVRALLPMHARTPANAAVCAAVIERLEGVAALALYRAIGSKGEIDLTPVDAAARMRGIAVAYPTLEEDGSMSFRFAATLEDRGNGFEEPPLDSAIAGALDLIVVPALAYDERGHRIGYGAGYYDRTLPHFPAARTVGVAYDFQLLMEVPFTQGDIPVQTIVTEKRVIEVAGAR